MIQSRERIWSFQQILYSSILEDIDSIFSHIAIRYMPVKGSYLLCKGIAGQLKYRKMTDIDILVEPAMLKPVSDFLMDHKNCTLKKYFTLNYRQTESSFWYSDNTSRVCLEIQSELNVRERFSLDTETLFQRGTKINNVKYLPCPEDALLIFICHLQSHMPFEFRETNFEEMKLFIEDKKFSFDKFWEAARDTGMESFISFMFHLFNKQFKTSVLIPKDYIYAILLSFIFNEITYAHTPLLIRRILFDIPFVKEPVKLMLHKITHRFKSHTLLGTQIL